VPSLASMLDFFELKDIVPDFINGKWNQINNHVWSSNLPEIHPQSTYRINKLQNLCFSGDRKQTFYYKLLFQLPGTLQNRYPKTKYITQLYSKTEHQAWPSVYFFVIPTITLSSQVLSSLLFSFSRHLTFKSKHHRRPSLLFTEDFSCHTQQRLVLCVASRVDLGSEEQPTIPSSERLEQ
jgi:hypothetical protein